MRVGMGCKAQNAGNVGYLAKFCNAADRPIPRTSRPSRDFEQVLRLLLQHMGVGGFPISPQGGRIVQQQGFLFFRFQIKVVPVAG